MKFAVSLLLLVLAPSLFAADAAPQPRNPFPDDYVRSSCAPANSCLSFSPARLGSAAFTFQGLSLSERWITAHYDETVADLQPLCQKHATCIATPGNGMMFCNDLIAPLFRDMCSKKYGGAAQKDDLDQCRGFVEIYALGMDQHVKQLTADAQACAGPRPVHTKPPIVWMSPETIDYGDNGYVTFYAIDADTHVPVPAIVTLEAQKIYAPSNPTGETASYYPFKIPFRYAIHDTADGHRTLVPPIVTVAAPNYPVVTFPLATPQPNVIVTMEPAPAKLKRGQTVTVHATDAKTGTPVELRVRVGNMDAGDTNQPITIDWPANTKRPEIWARSLFDRYSDVIIVPAEK
jgi:hypothetical protein